MINISIEPTSFCNAKCYYCINSIDQLSRSQRREYLSLDTHNKLIRELDIFINDFHCAPTFDKSIYLRYCGVGEPTLHSNFIKMFKEGLACSNVKMLAILSNGTGWIKRMTDELIETIASRINIPIELIFSLDTIYPQTQFRIKKLSDIDVVIKQLTYLVDQKIKKKINNIYIIFQMIILEDNINEVKQFCNFWTKLITNKGCCVKIVYMPTYANLFSKNNFFIWLKCRESDNISQKKYTDLHKYALDQVGLSVDQGEKQNSSLVDTDNYNSICSQQFIKASHICSMLWYGVNIAANGDVSPCCNDVNFDLKIGNLNKNSLLEIYRGDAMKHMRFAHINGKLQDYPICMNCNMLYRENSVSHEEISCFIDNCNNSA